MQLWVSNIQCEPSIQMHGVKYLCYMLAGTFDGVFTSLPRSVCDTAIEKEVECLIIKFVNTMEGQILSLHGIYKFQITAC